ncbi:amino acid/amide ABC transporter ATP-binding protein 1, HAAT family [Cribrihabitans marinus]|uniref:Amino acid/amide ABC transporter ATP-binding protein 1, HAAT family n=1 Tax=Cribrihabitans marinus TaxID=1227549 RepID=A0A1H6ZFB5_9RHOB|nr:ABC transporter ATP-binding protein [Cribrihabitans marinus]GGH31348.1 ABC transporter ATP-binding protein [Cribrihabitans marinus]SEJ48372.1 amino acid/amide ABC transporter ATP-binding protein 1, HAAT family [Cribrihabitans marinus]
MAEQVLSCSGLTRDFGPFRAVDQVSLEIRTGSITGLIGPNGAGKSTLFDVLTGMLAPTAGTVRLNGQDVTGFTPEKLFAAGLGRSFQIPRPFARMSVLENVMLAPLAQIGERVSGPFLRRSAMRAQERAIRSRAMEVLDFVTLAPLADHPAGRVSGGQMKLLELARVLMGDPAVILLDEPAAGVNPTLTGILIEKIEELNRQGKTFVIIEHDMDFIMRHCDPVVALAGGRVVFQGTAEEAQANPVLLDAYLGAGTDA